MSPACSMSFWIWNWTLLGMLWEKQTERGAIHTASFCGAIEDRKITVCSTPLSENKICVFTPQGFTE